MPLGAITIRHQNSWEQRLDRSSYIESHLWIYKSAHLINGDDIITLFMKLSAILCLLLLSTSLWAQSFKMTKVDSFEKLSNTNISKEWGEKTLTEDYFDPLKHVETEHFIFHYERSPSKIARRAEGIYTEIMEFMGNPEDKAGDQKSHIYVIPDYDRWQKWCLQVAQLQNIGGMSFISRLKITGENLIPKAEP